MSPDCACREPRAAGHDRACPLRWMPTQEERVDRSLLAQAVRNAYDNRDRDELERLLRGVEDGTYP